MNATGPIQPARVTTLPPSGLAADAGERRRWGGALMLVLAAHTLPAILAGWWLGPAITLPATEPAMLIDMAAPAAAPVPPSDQPPGPERVKAKRPVPQEVRAVVRTPTVADAAVSLPVRPPEPPRQAARAVAPETTAPRAPPVAAAPVASNAAPTWQGLVLGRLNQFKRYPREAQSRRQQGAPHIRFVMDREGRILSSSLARGSGYVILDREAVALPRRAQPLPKPPPEVAGQTVELVVPVEFYLQ